MKLNRSLKLNEDSCCACAPCSDSDKDRFPTLYWDGKAELNLPESGTMTVRFRRTGCGMRETDTGGKSYSVTLEIEEILTVEGAGGEKEAKGARATESALDEILAKLKEDSEEEGED